MRKAVLLLCMLTTLATMAQSPLVLTLEDFEIQAGETKQSYIVMQNAGYEVIAIEFKIELPEGVSLKGIPALVKDRIGSGTNDSGNTAESAKTVNAAQNAAGDWICSIFSMTDLYPFSGTEGNVLELTFVADADMAIGEKPIRLYDIELSTLDAPYYPEASTNQVTVYKNHTVSTSVANEGMGTCVGGGTMRAGTTTEVNAMANEGYHFVNWTVDGTEVSQSATYSFIVNSDIHLVANFAPNQYMMTFVFDNGDENVVKTQDYGSELTAPDAPTKTGFTFKGWSPEVSASVPASNKVFTAQWERNKYQLTFMVDGTAYKQESVLFEATIVKPEDPVKEGYTFTGWTPEIGETMPAENVTYTAQFSPLCYVLTPQRMDLYSTGGIMTKNTKPCLLTMSYTLLPSLQELQSCALTQN